MVSSLLLPLLFAASPAPVAAASADDPPIQLWINERRFLPGDRAKVQVRTEYDGYLLVLHVDADGRLRVLFPIDPDKDNFVRGDKKYEVRGRGGREAFQADGKGRGAVYAAVSRDPFRFDGYVMGDHWDYRALAPSRLADDPEPELNELVQRMAQGSFDYDLITYDVVDRSTYATEYYPRYYGSVYDDPWCYRFSCGHGYYGSPYSVSIGLFFGRPYRRYYYDPYYYAYDPFYNPFFYDPYYYAPIYYPRYVYPRRYYHYSYYDRYYYWDRNRAYRSYTPYRFRGADGFTAGYRDRRYDLRRSVNTVYIPPVSRVREPSATSPVRRVIEGPAAELPSRAAPRRAVGHEQRLDGRKVEARRARERDDLPRTVSPGDARGRERSPIESRGAPRGESDRSRHDERSEPRLERRSEPRAVERPEQPRAVERRDEPRRAERAPAVRQAPRQDRGARSEGRSSDGSRPSGGARSSDGGGRRRN
ncbi:MAG TPA: DUF4384 domain-containing protein [Gemmatimonadales bacterium]|nr:DUF4384 domain-containing protein [Gemmatimonadales bacterium]